MKEVAPVVVPCDAVTIAVLTSGTTPDAALTDVAPTVTDLSATLSITASATIHGHGTMKYNPNELQPEDYVMYRLYRFGETGRFGKEGPAKAGKHHGNVTARAWLMYEAGTRQPRIGEREKIARWLNSQVARYVNADRRTSSRAEPERREANRAVTEQVLGGDFENAGERRHDE